MTLNRKRLLLIVALVTGGYLVARWLYEITTHLFAGRLSPGLAASLPVPAYAVLSVLVALAASRLAGGGLLRSAFVGPAAVLNALIGVAVGMALVATGLLVAYALGLISYSGTLFGARPFQSLLAGAVIVTGIALVEEILFRTVALALLLRIMSWPAGMLLAALLFAAVHVRSSGGTGIAYLLGIFALGLLLGAAYIRTRSLWLPVGIHWGWNFAQAVALLATAPGQFAVHGAVALRLIGYLDQPEAGLIGVALLLLATAGLLVVPSMERPPTSLRRQAAYEDKGTADAAR